MDLNLKISYHGENKLLKWLVIYQWFHEFSDSWGTTMVDHKRRKFEKLTCQITGNYYLRLLQILEGIWVWIWVNGKMGTKNISQSAAFRLFFFTAGNKMFMSAMQLKSCLKILNMAHAWSYYVTNLDKLDCSLCFAKKKLKN